ncbi:hypothetical protein [Sinorhizobium sp. GL28]|uniref:hypothetical protein n=1 Tax=Sinorhizobium sp. GL28 TaxID=1358418 RepID=UPI00071C3352|nr:hypothetical protein [Sinorhizobium sp. GL28]KSV87555.1 hypothetical protein N184_30845 [Sinorhizobium sp. GL28]
MEQQSPDQDEHVSELGMQEAYRLVVRQVQQLRKARQVLDAKLAKAEEAQESLRQFLTDAPSIVPEGPNNSEAGTRKKKKFRKGSQTAEVIARSKNILKEAGRPLERGDLLERIRASGFQVTTRDPARFIGRTLWESEDFIHIPKEGYWLAGHDVPVYRDE